MFIMTSTWSMTHRCLIRAKHRGTRDAQYRLAQTRVVNRERARQRQQNQRNPDSQGRPEVSPREPFLRLQNQRRRLCRLHRRRRILVRRHVRQCRSQRNTFRLVVQLFATARGADAHSRGTRHKLELEKLSLAHAIPGCDLGCVDARRSSRAMKRMRF